MEHKKTFVIANKKIKIPNDLFINKGDVGIIESETQNTASIFFVRVWEKVELNKKDFQVFNVKKQEMLSLKKFVMSVTNF